MPDFMVGYGQIDEMNFIVFIKDIDFTSGVSFLYNADVMTSALFGISKNLKLSFL